MVVLSPDGAVLRDVFSGDCPTRQVLARVGDKWTTLIVGALEDNPLRFGALARRVDGISPKVLAKTIADLERDGIVHREVLSVDPPAVEYSITGLGAELAQIVRPLRAWAEDRFETIETSRRHFDAERRDVDRAPWQTPRAPR